ncbi:hypothetical protein EBT31_03290 [bacterium]|nr:hypothetical protein [bacterium]
MSHPHHYLLEEYRLSIEKLVPLTPREITEEAHRLYEELLQNEHASERQIQQALIEIGKKEYPYRKAYEALCATDEERRLEEAAFSKIDPEIAEKIRAVTAHGVHLTDYANSKLFETQLTSEERYRVERAILEAHDVINRQCDERAHARQESFDELVKRWTEKRDEIQRLIGEMRNMASRSPELSGEILGKAAAFEEGWSIVSRDPGEKEVREALSSFATQLEEQSDDDMLTL